MELGDFNAVKRFPLQAIDDESLGSIEVCVCVCALQLFISIPFHVAGYIYMCSMKIVAFTILD